MQVILAQPRGFCAGVERAIEIVEMALEKFGPPIYVRHEIVHNPHVVKRLAEKGVKFVLPVDTLEADAVKPGANTRNTPPLTPEKGITDGWPAYEAALKANNKVYEAYIYPNVNHGFHNDSTPRYDEAAAKLAWERTIGWFNRYLAS